MDDSKTISHVGIEVEAGWLKRRDDLIVDGSLRAEEFTNKLLNYGSYGELVSPPFNKREDLFKYLKDNYPDEMGKRCSIHVHFSLKSLDLYCQCMELKFYNEYFLPDMKKWGEEYPCKSDFFWERLNGLNEFCTAYFVPDKQVPLKRKGTRERYTHLNFSYAMHKTIECRLFPTFKEVETAISAISALLNCVERYLGENPPKKESFEDTLIQDKQEGLNLDNEEFVIAPERIEVGRFNYFECVDMDELKKSVPVDTSVPTKPKKKPKLGIFEEPIYNVFEGIPTRIDDDPIF